VSTEPLSTVQLNTTNVQVNYTASVTVNNNSTTTPIHAESPSSNSENIEKQNVTKSLIPRQLFFTWITKDEEPMAAHMQSNLEKWKTMNPEYNIKLFGGLWNDSEQGSYMTENCSQYYATWDAIIEPIAAKCDVFRYCLLYNEGGVWSDVDIVPLASLKNIINDDVDLFVVHDGGMASVGSQFLANGFFGVTAKHPVMKRALEIVEEHHAKRMKKGAVWVTGPGVLWKAVNDTQYAVQNKEKVQYVDFDGRDIRNASGEIILKGKYDGYGKEANANGGETHNGRWVQWRD